MRKTVYLRKERPTGKLAELVAKIHDDQSFQVYLRLSAKFSKYSLRNQLLILDQKPDATLVAGYHEWRKLGRQVRKGERGITIFAPHRRTDRKTGEDDGLGFHPEDVWDVSQTDGEVMPERPKAILPTGNVHPAFMPGLLALADEAKIDVRFDTEIPEMPNANGVWIPGLRRIVIRNDRSPAARCKTLCHELSHALSGDTARVSADAYRRAEMVAESVAFIVCERFGLDTSGYSAAYVACYAEPETMQAAMTQINQVAKTIIARVETFMTSTTPIGEAAG